MAATTSLSDEELADNLQKCAALVRLHNKSDPLLRQTIHDLTFFITGKRVSPRPSSKASVLSSRTTTANPSSTTSPAAPVGGGGGKMAGLPATTPLNGEGPTTTTTATVGRDPTASSSFVGGASVPEVANVSSRNVTRNRTDPEPPPPQQPGSHGGGSSSAAAANININNNNNNVIKPSSSRDENWNADHGTTLLRPEFRRPTNPNSSLIANGWIEQQRRSKMRTVWKQVIMSLVEGKNGQSPALWIQREVILPDHAAAGGRSMMMTKKPELEALHQIPAGWIVDVKYAKYSADNKFTLTVKNMAEEFIFRCPGSAEAAQDWVVTIRSIMGPPNKTRTSLDDWDEEFTDDRHHHHSSSTTAAAAAAGPTSSRSQQQQQQPPEPNGISPPAVQRRKTPPPPPAAPPPPPPPSTATTSSHHPTTAEQPPPRMSVSELRAIAHGAGITTHGMERGELERVVQQLFNPIIHHHRTVTPEVPSSSSGPSPKIKSAAAAAAVHNNVSAGGPWDEQGAAETERQENERRLKEEAVTKAERERLRLEKVEKQKRQEAEEKRRREMEQQKIDEQRRREEEERRRLEAERLRREEEEHRKRVAEMQAAEQRRREEEQRRLQQQQWTQQQQEWQRQQEEEAQRRQVEEARLAEERRRQEEAFRKHQQWQQQQAAQQQQHPAWQQQHQQQQQTPFGPHFAPPPPQQQHQPHPGVPGGGVPPTGASPVNLKYAKMATQATDGRRQLIKHSVLVEWALQPPTMQILRSIEFLITTIHTVFPPKYGVAPHEHFGKWSIVPMSDVVTGAQPDVEKLNKAVRKLRFFLHPDKLPREFTEEQHFVCKMLWDITSDAYEEFKKRDEELGWMR